MDHHNTAQARISHQGSSRGGGDGRGYKARDRGPRRRSRNYVEEPDRAQRSRHACIRRRSRSLVRNAGWAPAHTGPPPEAVPRGQGNPP